MNFERQKLEWFKKSRKKPLLKTRIVSSNKTVVPLEDPTAWQGISFQPDCRPLEKILLNTGCPVYIDFGESLVGKIRFGIQMPDRICDAPIRLRLRFAELPYEAVADTAAYKGGLCQSWIQEEIITIDQPTDLVELPRRYAFRYFRIELLAAVAPVRIMNLECLSVTSGEAEIKPVAGKYRRIDEVGLRTLRNCMQEVFEDGPKRDRRLWLGDLRLQALVNGVTCRNFELFERSLYLLASGIREDGLFPAAVFDRDPVEISAFILDYALLLPVLLLEHLNFSGDSDFCREFFPVAAHQMELMRKNFDGNGLFADPKNIWIFIDWSPSLERDSAITCIFVFALRQLAKLAKSLGMSGEQWEGEAEIIASTLYKNSFDKEHQVIVSGRDKQISWASQAWAVLAGVLNKEEGTKAFHYLQTHQECIRPKTPYLWHYVAEACILCGEYALAIELFQNYWGGMIRNGADTFWEAYVPEEPFFSPYNDPLVNSACHAWSCTPSYFLRLDHPAFQNALKQI